MEEGRLETMMEEGRLETMRELECSRSVEIMENSTRIVALSTKDW